MHLKRKICILLTLLVSLPGHATLSINNPISSAQLIGEARLKVMLWNVFDAKLYAPPGYYDANQPFALSLTYLRALDGKKIVSKSMEEIRRQALFGSAAQHAKWQVALSGIIPDVYKGTTLTGVRSQEGYTLFYLGGDEVGRIEDTEFTQAFFAIWLGEKTSNPRMRNRLTGTRGTT